MNQPALIGGLFIGILSALPILSAGNLCCCLWVVGGGVAAAFVDRQNAAAALPLRRGAVNGLMAGIAGAFVWLVAAVLLDLTIGPLQRRFAEQVARTAQSVPPETRAWLEMLASRSTSPLAWISGFFFQLLAGVIFAPIGGMLGALFFRNHSSRALDDAPLP